MPARAKRRKVLRRRPRVASVATVEKRSVSLPGGHWEWLKHKAVGEGISLSYYLSMMVEAYMGADEGGEGDDTKTSHT